VIRVLAVLSVVAITFFSAHAEDPPDAKRVKAVELFKVPAYCEGVVFDYEGNGYVSWDKSITKFKLDGTHEVWAETGAPNGHKIFPDGTHGVCDASQHAVLRLSADGELLEPWSTECNGVPLRGPNDMTRTGYGNVTAL
jgi:gluconolactonase